MPEIASRHHLELVNVAVDQALAEAGAGLDDVDLVAVTQGPGLVGALLIGVATAKAIAAGRELPLAPVDHLQGHVAANFVGDEPFAPPFLCLIASGGHTLLARVDDHAGYTTLGATLDDAAGEAFDKGARLLGLGYPGGPALSRLALDGDPQAFAFPAGERMGGLDFSFAGLKTALLYAVRDLGEEETRKRAADLAASYEHAIVEALLIRVRRAVRDTKLERVAIGGGVAANRVLRERVAALGVDVHVPPASSVHRQRGDDRVGRALGRAACRSRTTSSSTRTRPSRARNGANERAPGVAGRGVRDRPGGAGRRRVPARRGRGGPRRTGARGDRGGLPGGVADPVPYDGRSPAEPPAARERVLVELPRPALGERRDLADLDGKQRRTYVDSLEQEAKALISALRARGLELARRRHLRAHLARLRRDDPRPRPAAAGQPRRAQAAGAALLPGPVRAGPGRRRLEGGGRRRGRRHRRRARRRRGREGLRRRRPRRRPRSGRRPARSAATRAQRRAAGGAAGRARRHARARCG